MPHRQLAVTCIVAAVLIASLGGCRPKPPLPVLGTAPQFELVDRQGTTITTATFAGKPWIVDFIFTRCPAICPLMTSAMASVDQRTAERELRLASITLDPGYDTAEKLDEFASRHGASSRWLFLRPNHRDSEQAETAAHAVSRGFALGSEPATGETPLVHSTRLVLVDAEQQIRGYYDALDPDEIERLLSELDRLPR